MSFRSVALVLCAFWLSACQTTQSKNLALIQDRAAKLKPLSNWSPVLCKAEVTLSQPAAARYKEMYPKEKLEEPWEYTWKAREVACEVYGSKHSPMRDSHKTFMETAMCLLLQTHWVNSPFDELAADTDSVVSQDPYVQIKMGEDPALGIFLGRQNFTVETRTKTRGTILAEYAEREGAYVLHRIENRVDSSVLAIEEPEYESGPRRPVLKGFWISVGAEQPFRHSFVSIKECKPY
jgi:hypothetical protein